MGGLMCEDQKPAPPLTAREAALRIEELHGWTPTKDPARMDSIQDKVRMDMVGMIEQIILRVGR
jgi:hypothetical protein